MGVFVKIDDNTKEVLAEFQNQKERCLERLGIAGERFAKQEITDMGAVDTGRLRNSISHASDGKAAYIGTNVEYAPYVELGTSRGMKPRPYLKQAVRNHVDEYKQIVQSVMKG